ncbi:hypothetical protein HOC13_03985 [Candidatus Woesearchaeota archaeon]|jgi:hypothetical protein|nr:hypothetical protein [Candidatus Woesearchaeota archaeon]
MASGNFLIGQDLTLEGFDQYVQPLFEEHRYSVQDKIVVPYETHGKSILVSVVGEGDLEQAVSNALVESVGVINRTEEENAKQAASKGQNGERIAWEHQVSTISHYERDEEGGIVGRVEMGVYELIGVYNGDNTASELFPSIAQGYLLKNVEKQAQGVARQIKSLLSKRLSEL